MKNLLILLLGMSGLAACRPKPADSGRQATPAVPEGQPAPAFRLMDTAGKPVALQDFRGKVVYLDFWYSGCKPCLAEAPAASALKQQFLGKDIVFAYISIDTNVDAWRQTIAKFTLSSANSVHLLDPEGWHAARAYGIKGFPTYWLIGRDGRIWQKNASRPSDGAQTVASIKRALAASRR